MEKSLALLKKGFESSSGTTPEFLEFYKTFKKEFTEALTKLGCTNIQVGKGHFYVSGFFTAPNGQPYYFSMSDVRSFSYGSEDSCMSQLLYRTARDYKDYTGGYNCYVRLSKIHNMDLHRTHS